MDMEIKKRWKRDHPKNNPHTFKNHVVFGTNKKEVERKDKEEDEIAPTNQKISIKKELKNNK